MIVEKNIQIQKMESDMEKMIKERELQINTGVGTSTKIVSTTEIESTSKNPIEQLSKAMGDLSLKDMEIEKPPGLCCRVKRQTVDLIKAWKTAQFSQL